MGNGPFIDDCPIKTSIYKGFSMAMLNNQMVSLNIVKHPMFGTPRRPPQSFRHLLGLPVPAATAWK